MFYARSKRIKAANNRHGLGFDSGEEMARWEYLLLRQSAGEICKLEHHPIYFLIVTDLNGMEHQIGTWEADSRYFDYARKQTIIEDVKGAYNEKKKQTKGGRVVREWTVRSPILDPVYVLKKKIIEAYYGFRICEVWDGEQHWPEQSR